MCCFGDSVFALVDDPFRSLEYVLWILKIAAATSEYIQSTQPPEMTGLDMYVLPSSPHVARYSSDRKSVV